MADRKRLLFTALMLCLWLLGSSLVVRAIGAYIGMEDPLSPPVPAEGFYTHKGRSQ